MSVRARTSRLTLSRPTSASSSPSTAWDVRAGSAGTSAATGSTARGEGTAPSSPGVDWVAVRTAGGGGVAVRRALSSLLQSSTTGPVAELSPWAPPSANS